MLLIFGILYLVVSIAIGGLIYLVWLPNNTILGNLYMMTKTQVANTLWYLCQAAILLMLIICWPILAIVLIWANR